MGFLRRLVAEGSKQLNEATKQMNEAMKEFERQANAARSQQQPYSGEITQGQNQKYMRYMQQQVGVQIRAAASESISGILGGDATEDEEPSSFANMLLQHVADAVYSDDTSGDYYEAEIPNEQTYNEGEGEGEGVGEGVGVGEGEIGMEEQQYGAIPQAQVTGAESGPRNFGEGEVQDPYVSYMQQLNEQVRMAGDGEAQDPYVSYMQQLNEQVRMAGEGEAHDPYVSYMQQLTEQVRIANERIGTSQQQYPPMHQAHGSGTMPRPANLVNPISQEQQRAQEQQLSNMRIQMMNNQIRRAEEQSMMMGMIGTNDRMMYDNTPNVRPPSHAINRGPISQEQQLSNMRIQMMNNQIRRSQQQAMMMGTIGTNSHLVYTYNNKNNNTGSSYGYSRGGGLGDVG